MMTALDIRGPRNVAVKKYAKWQQPQVEDPLLKEEFRAM